MFRVLGGLIHCQCIKQIGGVDRARSNRCAGLGVVSMRLSIFQLSLEAEEVTL